MAYNGYAPMTDEDPVHFPWWFHPSDRRFLGMRVTHQPSPWIMDYGEFLINAYLPTNPTNPLATEDRFSGYSPHQSEFHPYYFGTNLLGYGTSEGYVKFELSPTQHGGIVRVTFPPYAQNVPGDDSNTDPEKQLLRIAVSLFGLPKHNSIEVKSSPIDGTVMISGYTKKHSGGVGEEAAAYAHYFP